jgi:hypothetical protein
MKWSINAVGTGNWLIFVSNKKSRRMNKKQSLTVHAGLHGFCLPACKRHSQSVATHGTLSAYRKKRRSTTDDSDIPRPELFHLFHPSLYSHPSSIIRVIFAQILHVLFCTLLIHLPAEYTAIIRFGNAHIITCELNTPGSEITNTTQQYECFTCHTANVAKNLRNKWWNSFETASSTLWSKKTDCLLMLSYSASGSIDVNLITR